MFGVEKKAVAVAAHLEGFERVMTRESYADFSAFVARHRSRRRSATIALDRIGLRLREAWNRRIRVAPYRLARLLTLRVPPGFMPRPGSWGYDTLLFHWSMEKLIPRYRVEPGASRAAAEVA